MKSRNFLVVVLRKDNVDLESLFNSCDEIKSLQYCIHGSGRKTHYHVKVCFYEHFDKYYVAGLFGVKYSAVEIFRAFYGSFDVEYFRPEGFENTRRVSNKKKCSHSRKVSKNFIGECMLSQLPIFSYFKLVYADGSLSKKTYLKDRDAWNKNTRMYDICDVDDVFGTGHEMSGKTRVSTRFTH